MPSYVLTGGPCAGKTTTILELQKLGYLTLPESSRQIIEEEQAKQNPILPWTNLYEFQRLVLGRQLDLESRIGDGELVFLDRGALDCVAYCRLGKISAPPELEELFRKDSHFEPSDNGRVYKHRYDGIFLLDPLPGVYSTDAQRRETPELAQQVHEMIARVYDKAGYYVERVPVLPPRKRAQYIVEKAQENERFKAFCAFTDLVRRGEIPKEFPEFEYENKFNIVLPAQLKADEEPGIEFCFGSITRAITQDGSFMWDDRYRITRSTEYYFSSGEDGVLVVTPRDQWEDLFENWYGLKRKSGLLQLRTGVPGEEHVLKRKEQCRSATLEEVLREVAAAGAAADRYLGMIRKEKVESHILCARDGRIFKPAASRVSLANRKMVQRQFELEYAGYLPGWFPAFRRDDEAQLVSDLVELVGRLTGRRFLVIGGCEIELQLTEKRKHDFLRRGGG